jgi:hypothetical protein
LNSPFREIANAGGRWHPGKIEAVLAGEPVLEEPIPPAATESAAQSEDDEGENFTGLPKYRRYAGLAIGGALAAAALCALLIRGAHQAPEPTVQAAVTAPSGQTSLAQTPAQTSVRGPVTGQTETTAPAATGNYTAAPAGWAVVGGSYGSATDAEKRLGEIVGRNSGLEAKVYSTGISAPKFTIVFASGLPEAQAKKQLARIRRGGAPRSTHLTRFE